MTTIDYTFGLFLAIASIVCMAWIYGTNREEDE